LTILAILDWKKLRHFTPCDVREQLRLCGILASTLSVLFRLPDKRRKRDELARFPFREEKSFLVTGISIIPEIATVPITEDTAQPQQPARALVAVFRRLFLLKLLSARDEKFREHVRKVLVQPGFFYNSAGTVLMAHLLQPGNFVGCDDHNRHSGKTTPDFRGGLLLIAFTVPVFQKLGSEFMPPLDSHQTPPAVKGFNP